MPRLPPSLFWRARREISPMAAQLLPACRDLQSTANELRWIREHVRDTKSPVPAGLRVWKLVQKRGKGVPLQYVLGTQPFGDLEIKCQPGVLIPRPETESYTLHIASRLAQDRPLGSSLSILDLCTGTGCIPLLLLHYLLHSVPSPKLKLNLHGVDISPHAVRLARANHHHNTTALRNLPSRYSPSTPYSLTFSQHDIFSPSLIPHLSSSTTLFHHPKTDPSPHQLQPPTEPQNRQPNAPEPQEKKEELDLLISNPPYISPRAFSLSTARSVRNYEPKLALVPEHNNNNNFQSHEYTDRCQPQDIFYARLLEITDQLRPKRVLMEVGGMEQALRVVRMVFDQKLFEDRGEGAKGTRYRIGGVGGDRYGIVEIWRDEPAARNRGERVDVGGRSVVVRGKGRGRAVYLSRVGR